MLYNVYPLCFLANLVTHLSPYVYKPGFNMINMVCNIALVSKQCGDLFSSNDLFLSTHHCHW